MTETLKNTIKKIKSFGLYYYWMQEIKTHAKSDSFSCTSLDQTDLKLFVTANLRFFGRSCSRSQVTEETVSCS